MALVPTLAAALSLVDLEQIRERGADLEANRRAASTRKVYARELAAFKAWAAQTGLPADPCDPASCYGYLVAIADTKALATVLKIGAVLSAIAKERGGESPLKNSRIAGMLDGLRREAAEKGLRQNARTALQLEDLSRALASLDRSTLIGKRDAALLLTGFAGAFRRSELVALDVEDLQPARRGITVHIRRSKTDQRGAGDFAPIPRATPSRRAR